MNHIFKKIWNKSLGRMVVVSEHAKSAGKTDNTAGVQANSLSNVHHDEQGKNEVFSFKPLVLKSLVLSIAAITGMNVWADDNYAHTPTETALGSASGFQYSITKTAGKITAVGGINVTTTGAGTSIDDIDSFTVNGVTTTKTADPAKVAAFINAAKKGGNIAVGQLSSAVGTANTASDYYSSAVGYVNTASGIASSALGYVNTASGIASSALGYGNATSGIASSALGYGNAASGNYSSAVGTANTASATSSNAIGSNNQATGILANAIGSGRQFTASNSQLDAINKKKITIDGVVITTINDITETDATTAANSLTENDIATINGKIASYDEKALFIDLLKKSQKANTASGMAASAVGVSNTASGILSSAVGARNTASGNSSSALGYGNTASGTASSALGYNNTASGMYSSALGSLNTASGTLSSAVGAKSTASGYGSSALGFYNTASGMNSSAFGNYNYAQNQSSVAMGARSIVDRPQSLDTSSGTLTSVNGIAVTATGTTIDTITHVNGTAVTADERNAFLNRLGWGGNLALADESSVFGVGGIATAKRATAIGFDSFADRANTISVGRAGAEKQITNVAAGTHGTDAVNLGQMNIAINTAIATIPTGGGTPVPSEHYVNGTGSSASGTPANLNGRTVSNNPVIEFLGEPILPNAIVLGFDADDVITKIDGMSVETTATSWADLINDPSLLTSVNGVILNTLADKKGFINSVLKGANYVLGDNSNAVGTQNIVLAKESNAVGFDNIVTSRKSNSIGTNNFAGGLRNANAIGTDNAATNLNSTAVGFGNAAIGDSSSAFGSGSMTAVQIVTGGRSPSLTLGGVITAIEGIAVESTATSWSDLKKFPKKLISFNGQPLTSEQKNAIVQSLKAGGNIALGKNSTVIGTQSIALANNSTAIGFNSIADRDNTISVGRFGAEKQITNVKAGIERTDAVNKGQLDDQLLTKANQSVVTDLTGRVDVNATNIRQLQTDLGTTQSDIRALDWRVTTNESDIAGLKTGLGNVAANAVIYDTADKDVITLAGGTNGTKITNLKDGTANSDAVNVGQLKTKADQTALDTGLASVKGYTDQQAAALNGKITTSATTINNRIDSEVGTLDGKITTNTNAISTLDGRVTTEVDNLNTAITASANSINTRIDGLDSTVAGIDGRVTANSNDIAALQNGLGNVTANAVTYDTADKDVITLAGTDGTSIKNVADGVDNGDAVNVAQLKTVDGNVTALGNRVTSEVDTLNTRIDDEVGTLDGRITTSANSINTRIDGVDTRIGQEVTTLNTRIDTANIAMAQAFGGGAAWNNGVFTQPIYTIQGKSTQNVGDALLAVDGQLSGIKESVTDLQDYTDQQTTAVLNDAKDYTDKQTTAALNDAKDYTDQQTTAALNDAKDYTDRQTTAALNDAKDYTDKQTTAALNDAKDYTDRQTTVALNDAKDYTDGQIADVKSQITANSQFTQVNGAANANAASATGENAIAIGVGSNVSGDNSVAVGTGNQVTGNNSGAFGDPNIVSGNASYVVGNDNTIKGDNTFVMGNNVNTEAKNAVVLGNDSASDRDNTVSVGATDKERQIIHVAAGTADTDAVNVAQMKQGNADTLNSAKTYTDARFADLESTFKDYSLQTERRFQEVDKRFDRQGAMSAAMMNMATSTSGLRGQNRVGVGAGFQGQEQAVAVGYQRVINDNTSLSISGALTKEESSGGVGVGFSW